MKLDKQRNFYDDKRYFQGKDNPGDFHPDPNAGAGAVSRAQLVFGAIFLLLIVYGIWGSFRDSHIEIKTSATPLLPAK